MSGPEPTVPTVLIVAWVAVLGACLGSFLNVVIARLPAGESIVSPGSRCPRCRRPIAWYDNVPLVSWVVLRGRCRTCRAPISIRYPAVELAVALLAVVAWHRHGLAAAALAELVLAGLLLALSAVDLDSWLLPHALTWPLIGLGLVVNAVGEGPAGGLTASALGGGIGFALFALVWLVGEKGLRREVLGFGDVFLLAGIGAWLGARALLPVLLLSSIQGTVVGVGLILAGRGQPGPPVAPELPDPPAPGDPGDPAPPHQPAPGPAAPPEVWTPPRHAVPFGPFLAAGALEWLYLSGPLAALVPALSLFR